MASRVQEGGGGMGSSGASRVVKAVKKAVAKKAAKTKPVAQQAPKKNVTVVKAGTMAENMQRNQSEAARLQMHKNGSLAKSGAMSVNGKNSWDRIIGGTKPTVVKIRTSPKKAK